MLVTHGGTTAVSAADLDGDGLVDLVAVNVVDSTVSVFYAKSGGGYRPPATFSNVAAGADPRFVDDAGSAGPVAAAIGDLDGDGRADIATVNVLGSISLLRQMPDGGFLAVAMVQSNLIDPSWIAAADLEDRNAGDGGLPDLVVSGLSGAGAASVEVYQNGCR